MKFLKNYLEPTLNEWQIGFRLAKSPPWRIGFYPYVRIWCLKLRSIPAEGEAVSKNNYTGFLGEWWFRKSIIVTVRTIKMPIWLGRFLLKLGFSPKHYYRIPIKIYLRKS